MSYNPFYKMDPYLKPFAGIINQREDYIRERLEKFTGNGTLIEFASGHLYYGMQKYPEGLRFREWAPNAEKIYITGSFNNWKEEERFSLTRLSGDGDWEIKLPSGTINHGDLYKLRVYWKGGFAERIPAYAVSVVQDDTTKIFSAVNWLPPVNYKWKNGNFSPSPDNPLIYEAHVGMSSEDERVSTFNEFRLNILPKIASSGYNTLQLMAIQEHPYYGSFGYHVSNFFAVSSRFGTPDDLKALVDEAHGLGIKVIIDLIHSHSVSNVNEGLAIFDGDPGLYFHTGARRVHKAWNSLCFNYSKEHVNHFLLSNCRYWMEEYRIDGFRFDGVTSMLYYDHGLEKDFTSYDMYYNGEQDPDAICYLSLANRLIHSLNPGAITIAEEMSGMPGVACRTESGGYGFDYRLAMGVPDFWIKIIKEKSDEDWDMDQLFHELTQHRPEERTISYAESHDQALVGDKTLLFRLLEKEMYTGMGVDSKSVIVDRGLALHKMIRLLTATTAQSAYLNFMGNEFGHPEWIDFPREGNGWSYKFARRQWSLAENQSLRYKDLYLFDNKMISFLKASSLLQDGQIQKIVINNSDNVIAYKRGTYIFVFNFHPYNSYTDYAFALKGRFRISVNTDLAEYGGFDRIDNKMIYLSQPASQKILVSSSYILKLYLPSRTALVLEELPTGRIK